MRMLKPKQTGFQPANPSYQHSPPRAFTTPKGRRMVEIDADTYLRMVELRQQQERAR